MSSTVPPYCFAQSNSQPHTARFLTTLEVKKRVAVTLFWTIATHMLPHARFRTGANAAMRSLGTVFRRQEGMEELQIVSWVKSSTRRIRLSLSVADRDIMQLVTFFRHQLAEEHSWRRGRGGGEAVFIYVSAWPAAGLSQPSCTLKRRVARPQLSRIF